MGELVRLAKEALRQQKAFGSIPSVRPGDRITWGADGTLRGPALVEFLHTDPDGITWAFGTCSTGWVAVNTKYILKHEDAGHD